VKMPGSPRLAEIETIKEIAVGELTSDYLSRYKSEPEEVFVFKKLLASRFQAEAEFVSLYTSLSRRLLGVQQENVIPYFEVFEEDDLCYVTAEYIAGRSFRQAVQLALDGEGVPDGVIRSVVRGCVSALKHVCSVDPELVSGGFFAGDLILGFDGSVRLKGFGIGRALEAAQDGLRTQIRSQQVSDWEQLLSRAEGETRIGLGSLALMMAPEALRGAGVEPASEMAGVLGAPLSTLNSLKDGADLESVLGDLDPSVSDSGEGGVADLLGRLFEGGAEAESSFLADNGFRIRLPNAFAQASAASEDGTIMLGAESNQTVFVTNDTPSEEPTTVVASQIDPELGVPSKLGPLGIQKKLGQGGMCAVFQGTDPGLEVTRAVKILLPELATDVRFLAKFKREARVAANVQHENIPTIYSVGEDQGFHYIIMEIVEGGDLKDLLTKMEKLPIPIALLIVSEVCRALDFAHNHQFMYQGDEVRGIIHRDIKPENIMLTDDGGIKLMDFGIARPTEVTGETVAGTVMGTFAYMSLEQLEGQSTIDGRADIFSLGVVLYELATGQRPFPGQTMTTVITKIMKGEFTPPHQLDPDLPVEIDEIVKKALERDREERYSSAAEMGQAINVILSAYEITSPRRVLRSFLEDGVIPSRRADAPALATAIGDAPPVAAPQAEKPGTQEAEEEAPAPPKKGKGGILALVAVLALLIGGAAYYFGAVKGPADTGVRVIVATNVGPAMLVWDGQEVASEGDGQNFIMEGVAPGQYRVVVTLIPRPDVKIDKMVVVKDTDTDEIVNIDFPVQAGQ